MRQRIGYIIVISGSILLCKPAMDQELITQYLNSFMLDYWPVLLILFGLLIMSPRKKRTRGKSR